MLGPKIGEDMRIIIIILEKVSITAMKRGPLRVYEGILKNI